MLMATAAPARQMAHSTPVRRRKDLAVCSTSLRPVVVA